MRHWGVTKGKKVGVVGLGGLGHMAVKFAHALGAHVVVFTTSPNKKEDALRLGQRTSLDVCDKSGSKEQDKSIPGLEHACINHHPFLIPLLLLSIMTLTKAVTSSVKRLDFRSIKERENGG
jgi:D-arabinose 1-dehydrogenase-like Zn-dependent alcohol dehydrogenase